MDVSNERTTTTPNAVFAPENGVLVEAFFERILTNNSRSVITAERFHDGSRRRKT